MLMDKDKELCVKDFILSKPYLDWLVEVEKNELSIVWVSLFSYENPDST